MTKWIQRCIAAVLLVTFHPGAPTALPQNDEAAESASIIQNIVAAKCIKAAEGAQGYTLDVVRSNGIKAALEDTACGRLINVALGIVAIIALFALPVLLPYLIIGAIIYAIVVYIIFGK